MSVCHRSCETRSSCLQRSRGSSTETGACNCIYQSKAYPTDAAADNVGEVLEIFHNVETPAVILSLADDYFPAHRYVQTHKTLELWLKTEKVYAINVTESCTPLAARRFIDMPTSFWNKCMGNVDTIRRII